MSPNILIAIGVFVLLVCLGFLAASLAYHVLRINKDR